MDYRAERAFILTADVKEKMYNVLLFVDGGWMVDVREVSSVHCYKLHLFLSFFSE